MAKRFTDTDKWKDDWFLSLNNDQRVIWSYLCDNCTISGIFKKNFVMLNMCCRTDLNEECLLNLFNKHLIDCGSFFFIPKFLKFQYPKGLNSDKPAIVSIRTELFSYGVDFIVRKLFGNDYLIIKDKDKDKDKDNRSTPKIPSHMKNETLLKVDEWKKAWELENSKKAAA